MMNRKTCVLLSCAWLLEMFLPVTASARSIEEDSLVVWFGRTFCDRECVPALEQPLSLGSIEGTRLRVWKAWKVANARSSEEKLISVDPLEETSCGAWHLPSELEPDAVMNYRFGRKGTGITSPMPLFIYLHGSGPREREWAYGLQFAKTWQDAPSVYFIPQIPNGGGWYRWWQKSKQWAWEKLFRQAFLLPEIDASRIYLTGFSEGGYGSQRLASFYADYFAAVGPMAGGEPLRNAPPENLRNTPFYFRTGSLDATFNRNRLTAFVGQYLDSLQRADTGGYFHNVGLIPGYAHNGWSTSGTTPWLSRYRRNATPTTVCWEDFEMDGRRRNGFANLEVLERPEDERRYYEEHISGNVVDIVIRTVSYTSTLIDNAFGFPIEMQFRKDYATATKGLVRIYLNEYMVDLSRPVMIRVNGVVASEKILQPDLKHMMHSLSHFYDPLRIFPVAVDVAY